jgi:hypothetical protein
MEKSEINVISLIAERKIAQAQLEGAFDNLEGMGAPLPADDLATLPDDVRLLARILRSGGYLEGPGAPFKSFKDAIGEAAPLEAKSLRNLEKLRIAMTGPLYGRPSKTKGRAQLPRDEESCVRAERLMGSNYLTRILNKLFVS